MNKTTQLTSAGNGALGPETLQASAQAAAIHAFLDQHGLTADALIAHLSTDANGRRINTTIAMGQSARSAISMNEAGLMPELLGRLQRAVTTSPTYRWQTSVGQQEAALKTDATQAVTEAALALRSQTQMRPIRWLAACVEKCDITIRLLEKQKQDALTALRQAEDELKQAQTQIDKLLRQSSHTGLLSKMSDVATSLLRWVDKGVNVAALTVSTERLLNEREAQAFAADVTAAAARVMQAARAQTQAERETLLSFLAELREAHNILEHECAAAQVRLTPNPYADVDLTSPSIKDRLSQSGFASAGATNFSLDQLMSRHATQRATATSIATDIKQAPVLASRERLSTLSLIEVMEMEAQTLETRLNESGVAGGQVNDLVTDLVIEAMTLVYERANQPSLLLDRRAQTISTRFVGVTDESNPVFGFSGANLVSTGRRDQVQFVRVQTGIALHDLIAYNESSEAFEQAARQRNYFVLSELAQNSEPRRAFALGLACGFIVAKGGAFVCTFTTAVTSANSAQPSESVRLGETIDEAMAHFAGRADLVEGVDTQLNLMPLETLTARLEAYLKRGLAAQDNLGRELADYVRERLEAAREQHRYAAEISPASSLPTADTAAHNHVVHVVKEKL